MGRDRGPELALEPLDDHRGVGLAHRPEHLLAGVRALQASGRLLLEHPGQGRPHLVEVLLGDGLDRHQQRRSRELERRQPQRPLLRGERVAGLGHGQLRDRPDLAGLELADGLLVLAVQQQELPDPLVLVAGRVPDVRLGAQRARQDPQVREPADERVRGRLEDPDQQGTVLVGGDLDLGAALVEAR